MFAKVEFDVQMKCESCKKKILEVLEKLEGVKSIQITVETGSVLVETNLPSSVIKEKIESTGRRAVLKGYGGYNGAGLTQAAVAMLGGPTGFAAEGHNIQGVVRLVQLAEGCLIDGTIDGLAPGLHGLHVHEAGDLTDGCASCGNHFDVNNSKHGGPEDPVRHTGDLGNIEADSEGRATFRLTDAQLKVWDIIGRSVVVTERPDDCGKGGSPRSQIDGDSGNRLACGIISRSAGLFENVKKICACDGVTLWDERDKPLAGGTRSSKQS